MPCYKTQTVLERLIGPSTVREIHTELVIPATPAEVWEVLGDFAHWGDWNDFCWFTKVPTKVGQTCEVKFLLNTRCMKISTHDPEILVLDTNRELRWADFRGELISNFFRGSHWWTLEPLPDGTTRLIHGAKVMGLALPFLQNSTMKATAAGYPRMNQALCDEVLARQQGGRSAAARATISKQRRGGKRDE